MKKLFLILGILIFGIFLGMWISKNAYFQTEEETSLPQNVVEDNHIKEENDLEEDVKDTKNEDVHSDEETKSSLQDFFSSQGEEEDAHDEINTDNTLIIEKLNISVPIVTGVGKNAMREENWDQLEKDIQNGLEKGVVHYPWTAQPNENGNFFITGNSDSFFYKENEYTNAFEHLDDLEKGDSYTVLWNENEYLYTVIETKIVEPEETSILDQPFDKKTGTLMTCYPVGRCTERFVVVAEQVEE